MKLLFSSVAAISWFQAMSSFADTYLFAGLLLNVSVWALALLYKTSSLFECYVGLFLIFSLWESIVF